MTKIMVSWIPLVTAAVLGGAACSDGGGDGAGDPPVGGTKVACVEDDLKPVFEFGGPGFDPKQGLIGPPKDQYLASSLFVELRPKATAVLQKNALPVVSALPKQEGLVGFSIASSEKCQTTRVLTVWESEEALLAFFGSDVHAEAMSHGPDIAVSIRAKHWLVPASEVPPSWDAVRTALADVEPIRY